MSANPSIHHGECPHVRPVPVMMSANRPGAAGSYAQLIAVLLLSAAFVGFGAWEVVRGNATIDELAHDHDRAATQLDSLQTLARTDPHATIQFHGSNQSYAAPLAATMMAGHQGELANDLWVATARLPFAWLTTVSALVALFAGQPRSPAGRAAHRSWTGCCAPPATHPYREGTT